MAKRRRTKVVPTKYRALENTVYSKLSSSFKSADATNILNQFKAGDTRLLKYDRVENMVYDPTWINEIEGALYDIGLIIQNPKKVTQEVTDVVPVELARKINGESVQHLATHSQYVKEQKENGEVIPNKILNIGSDDFYQTYENRFVATLIRKLVLFIEKRYQFLEENVNVRKTQVLMMKNKTTIDGKEVEIETKIKVSADDVVDDELINTNKGYIDRVIQLKKYIMYYYNSNFMKMMKTEKNVRNPIIMTNIIRKNPLYNHCFRLYKFIEKYDLVGVEYKVNEKYDKFDEKKLKEINNAFLTSFLTLSPDESVRKTKKTKNRKFRPHIEANTDDDIFIYGPYYKGPLTFVRSDEEFDKYLESSKYLVPPHLTNQEKDYWGAEIDMNKETNDELEEVAKLLRRKDRAFRAAEEEFEEIISERQREEALRQAREEIARENDILDEFNEARRKLMESALADANMNIDKPVIEEVNAPINVKKNPFVPFSTRIERAEESLANAYKRIRHEALCYGLRSRISKTADSMLYKNKTILKIAQVGKSLKLHYALNPNNYAESPIPVVDDSKHSSYVDIPTLLKVRSELSVRRAIKLIHDLAEKFGLTYTEIVDEEAVTEVEVPTENKLTINGGEFVPFSTRIEKAEESLANAYKEIRHHALCYGLKSRISRTADTFRLHNLTYLKIAQTGKSLKIHYALDAKEYMDSPIPVIDDSKHVSYIDIPSLLKVRSELSVRRAKKLIDDLAAKYGLIYKEIVEEEPEIEVEENVEVSNKLVINSGEFVPFSTRIEKAEESLAMAYKEIRHHALCYGLKSRISRTADTFRLHNVTYLKIAQTGKSLKLHYALDVANYVDSPIPVIDDSKHSSYAEIPALFKVRSELSVRRAKKLIDDLAAKYGLIYKEIVEEEPEIEVEEQVVEEVASPVINNKLVINSGEFVPFSIRIENAEESLANAYKEIRHHALCYGLKSRISKSADTFRLHNITFVKIAQTGKSLKIHFALNVKDYADSPIPVIDDSKHNSYKEIPLLLKVRSDLSVRRAIKLIDDLAAKNGFIYKEIVEETPIFNEIEEISEEVKESEKLVIISKEFIPFEKRVLNAEDSLRDAYNLIHDELVNAGFKSRISNSGDTFKFHNEKVCKIALVGKSLKIHCALDPKDYIDSPIPVMDDSKRTSYVDIPLMFKVRSSLSVRRAINLVNDLKNKYFKEEEATK